MQKTYTQRKNEPYRLLILTKMPASLDRRRKLSTEYYAEIRKRYAKGESQRQLARAYNVSRRLIVFVLYPERLERQKARKKYQKYSQKYYQTVMKGKKWAETMREHRHYKKRVMSEVLKKQGLTFNIKQTNEKL